MFISHQKGSFTEPNRPSSTFARFSVLFIVPLQFISIFFSCVTREGGFAWHATILFDVFFFFVAFGFSRWNPFSIVNSSFSFWGSSLPGDSVSLRMFSAGYRVSFRLHRFSTFIFHHQRRCANTHFFPLARSQFC